AGSAAAAKREARRGFSLMAFRNPLLGSLRAYPWRRQDSGASIQNKRAIPPVKTNGKVLLRRIFLFSPNHACRCIPFRRKNDQHVDLCITRSCPLHPTQHAGRTVNGGVIYGQERSLGWPEARPSSLAVAFGPRGAV